MFLKSMLSPLPPTRGTVSGETACPLHLTLRAIQHVVAPLAGARGGRIRPIAACGCQGREGQANRPLRVPRVGARRLRRLASFLMGADLAADGCQVRTHQENRCEAPQALRGQEET